MGQIYLPPALSGRFVKGCTVDLDRGGAFRPVGCPQGDERNHEVARGHLAWRCTIQLAFLCWEWGRYFFLERPRGSKAWLLRETHILRQKAGVELYGLDWCMYEDETRDGMPNRKPTRAMTCYDHSPLVQRYC